jgi:hypothetical protein
MFDDTETELAIEKLRDARETNRKRLNWSKKREKILEELKKQPDLIPTSFYKTTKTFVDDDPLTLTSDKNGNNYQIKPMKFENDDIFVTGFQEDKGILTNDGGKQYLWGKLYQKKDGYEITGNVSRLTPAELKNEQIWGFIAKKNLIEIPNRDHDPVDIVFYDLILNCLLYFQTLENSDYKGINCNNRMFNKIKSSGECKLRRILKDISLKRIKFYEKILNDSQNNFPDETNDEKRDRETGLTPSEFTELVKSIKEKKEDEKLTQVTQELVDYCLVLTTLKDIMIKLGVDKNLPAFKVWPSNLFGSTLLRIAEHIAVIKKKVKDPPPSLLDTTRGGSRKKKKNRKSKRGKKRKSGKGSRKRRK